MARSPETTREQFSCLTRQARRTARTPNAAQVHNLRVAIRRFGQALAVLPADTSGFKGIHRTLKKTMTLAGQVRDTDIAIKLIGKLRPTRAKALQARLSRRRARCEKRLLNSLRGLVLPPGIELPSPAGVSVHDTVLDAAKRLFKRGAKAEDAKGLHRLRIAAKKLRYTLELLTPGNPRLEQIKRLQSSLGTINDYETAQCIVTEESGGKKLLKQLADRQRKKVRQFRRYWESDFYGDDNYRRWMADLSHAGKRAAGA